MKIVVTALLGAALAFAVTANTETETDNPDMNTDQLLEPITVDNFVRAATHLEFDKYLSLAVGVNLFFHFQEPTPVDNQPTIRMNREKDRLWIGFRRLLLADRPFILQFYLVRF